VNTTSLALAASRKRAVFARELVLGGGLLGDRVHATVDVGVVAPVLLVHGVEHGLGFLGRRRGVEVHEALAVDGAREDREVGFHARQVVSHD